MSDSYKSEWATAGNGARMEIATIIHDGKEYTSGGSVINPEKGYLFAYVSGDEKQLKTWGGEVLGSLTITGHARGWHRTKLTCYQAIVGGVRYHGRGLGASMCIRMRKSKRQGVK